MLPCNSLQFFNELDGKGYSALSPFRRVALKYESRVTRRAVLFPHRSSTQQIQAPFRYSARLSRFEIAPTCSATNKIRRGIFEVICDFAYLSCQCSSLFFNLFFYVLMIATIVIMIRK